MVVETLISLIRKEICQEKSIKSGIIEEPSGHENSIYSISKAHDLAHIVGSALQKAGAELSTELSEKFLKQQTIAAYRYMKIEYDLEQICRAFERAKIMHMPLKGSVIRKYYPSPEMRTSCDIDMLVREEELDRAVAVLRDELHYEIGRKDTHDVSVFSTSGIHVELHFALIEDDKKVDSLLADIWSHSYLDVNSEYRYFMNNEYFVFYCIAHMAKHFLNGGCGIRPFMDLWIAENRMGFSREAVDALLDKCGLKQFGDQAFALCGVWFSGGEHTSLTQKMENYIVRGGVYGTVEHKVAISQTQQSGGKLRYMMRRIFLPYDSLKMYYNRLEKYPALYPFYQIKRWCRIMFSKDSKRAMRELQYSATVSDDEKQRLVSLCKELEIL